MQESSLQEKIEMLIGQLEEEVRKLSSSHQTELNRIREVNTIDLQTLNEHFEKRLTLVNSEYRSKISDLEIEIDYLKELNSAQRLMMEDNLGYIRGLEEKLNAARSLD